MHTGNNMNENKPLVSVLMSVYNTDENYLREAIDSVLKQTYSNFEFIIFNDHSNSNTTNVLSQYLKDKRIILINNSINHGLTYNLNKGLMLAKGKYIARMDSDDVCEPTRFEEQVNFLELNEDYAMVGSFFSFLTPSHEYKNNCDKISDEHIKSSLFFGNSCLMHSSVMLRTSVFNSNQYTYDLKFKKSQDFELWSRISHNYKIGIIPLLLMKYRISDGQISKKFASEQLYYKNIVLKRQLSILTKNYTDKELFIHLALCNGDRVSSLKLLYLWCKKIENLNDKINIFEAKSFSYYLNKHLLSSSLRNIKNFEDFYFLFLATCKYLKAKYKYL